ncbi:MAG: glycosyltransferase family 4 protein [Actinomycetota bacterium]|nr:glycosyltransferase family 4 protein [Actinomycetota bacterium]
MRIGYDGAPLLNPLTGVGHYTLSLLESLLTIEPEAGFELLAVTMRADTSRIPESPKVKLRHYRFPARIAVTGWELLRFPSVDELLSKPDIFHGTNFWVPPLKKAKGIVTIHDLTFLMYPHLCTPQVQRYRWIVPRVLKRCALVITPSETIRTQVNSELGFPSDRVVVTPEGLRGTFLGPSSEESQVDLLSTLGVSGDYICFVGTQEPRKNLDRLIEAFARLDTDLKLVIAGPAGWGSIDLPALAHKRGLDGRILFMGYQPDAVIRALVSNSRAFVFPTLYEGFGLPPLEAMAAGVPVVASRAGAHPETLGDAPIWCDPLDIDSITEAIHIATTNEQVRAEAIAKGAVHAATYTWDRTATLTAAAYRSVLSGG